MKALYTWGDAFQARLIKDVTQALGDFLSGRLRNLREALYDNGYLNGAFKRAQLSRTLLVPALRMYMNFLTDAELSPANAATVAEAQATLKDMARKLADMKQPRQVGGHGGRSVDLAVDLASISASCPTICSTHLMVMPSRPCSPHTYA